MLKIKLFNSRTPSESRELDLAPEKMINGECFIGRSPNCGLVLPSPEVSRIHGSIACKEGQYYFSDLASLSGSRLNDEVVKVNQQYPLQPNDIIRIGAFVLTIQTTTLAEDNGGVATPRRVEAAITTKPLSAPPSKSSPLPHVNLQSVDSVTPATPARESMPVAYVPPDQMNRWTKGELMVRCVGIIDETHDVKTFRFAADPPVLFTYQPGQFVILNLDINGKSVKRYYSISSTPSRPHTLDITVKRTSSPSDDPDAASGLVSNWLHDTMRVGSVISIIGPLGKFTCLAHPAQKLLMISAGSGITPMMAMSRWILDTATDCDIVFFHSARSPRDIIFRQELEWMSACQPKFRLAITITQSEPRQAWCGFMGSLNESMLCAIAPDFRERTIYICGSNVFMADVKAMLEHLGFPMQNYYEENFGGSKQPKQQPSPSVQNLNPAVNSTPSKPTSPPAEKLASTAVIFAKSKKEIICDGKDSILDLAKQEGIEIDSSCRSGVCGTCKQKKLAGEIKYEDDPHGLDHSDEDEGYILTCIAHPVGRVVINA